MNERLVVRNLSVPFEKMGNSAFIYCIGYETRSRFIAQEYKWWPEKTIAIEYSIGQVLSFEANQEFARQSGFKIVSDQHTLIEAAIRQTIASQRESEGTANITIDVSSMDRSLMSRVLLNVLDKLDDGETMFVLYSPSAFAERKTNLVPITNSGAAHPRLAGQVSPPDSGRVALLGLGYEYGVSLSILEAHEPDISFIFRPNGFDDRFRQAVRDANFGFDFGERNYEIIDYFLEDMAGAYDDISSLVLSTKHNSTIIAVPMGPKILSAVMILAGRLHQPQLSVLRYSVAPGGSYQDVLPEGLAVGISVTVIRDREVSAIHRIMSGQRSTL